MLTSTLDLVMLGSSAVASSCCVAGAGVSDRTAGAGRRATWLAAAMPIAMATAMFTDRDLLAWLMGAGVLALAASLLRSTRIDLHRGVGGVLMSALIFLHLHLMQMSSGPHHRHPSATGVDHQHGHVVDHGLGTHALVTAAVVASASYVVWTVREIRGIGKRPRAGRLTAEFASMSISVAAMAFGTLLEVHAMHA